MRYCLPPLRIAAVLRGACVVAAFVAAFDLRAELIVDTGHSPLRSQAGPYLYDTRYPGSGEKGYQQAAARFELSDVTRIGAIASWTVWYGGGPLSYAIARDSNGLPGEIILKAARVVPRSPELEPEWVTFRNLDWTLEPGAYWVVFRDIPEPRGGGSGQMSIPAPRPIPGAQRSDLTEGWVYQPDLALGVRIWAIRE